MRRRVWLLVLSLLAFAVPACTGQVQSNSAPMVRPGATLAGPLPASIAGLPLVTLAAQGKPRDLLAVILSGDGGWAEIDRELASRLAAAGIEVAGLNSLRYFWTPRNPETAAADLERILRHFLADHPQRRIVLIGYSFGADVLPFMARRLPEDLKRRVTLLALLSPGRTAAFEFHLSDWLGAAGDGLPVRPELAGLKGTRILCGYGREEKGGLCRELSKESSGIKVQPLAGGHHYDGHYDKLAQLILGEIDHQD